MRVPERKISDSSVPMPITSRHQIPLGDFGSAGAKSLSMFGQGLMSAGKSMGQISVSLNKEEAAQARFEEAKQLQIDNLELRSAWNSFRNEVDKFRGQLERGELDDKLLDLDKISEKYFTQLKEQIISDLKSQRNRDRAGVAFDGHIGSTMNWVVAKQAEFLKDRETQAIKSSLSLTANDYIERAVAGKHANIPAMGRDLSRELLAYKRNQHLSDEQFAVFTRQFSDGLFSKLVVAYSDEHGPSDALGFMKTLPKEALSVSVRAKVKDDLAQAADVEKARSFAYGMDLDLSSREVYALVSGDKSLTDEQKTLARKFVNERFAQKDREKSRVRQEVLSEVDDVFIKDGLSGALQYLNSPGVADLFTNKAKADILAPYAKVVKAQDDVALASRQLTNATEAFKILRERPDEFREMVFSPEVYGKTNAAELNRRKNEQVKNLKSMQTDVFEAVVRQLGISSRFGYSDMKPSDSGYAEKQNEIYARALYATSLMAQTDPKIFETVGKRAELIKDAVQYAMTPAAVSGTDWEDVERMMPGATETKKFKIGPGTFLVGKRLDPRTSRAISSATGVAGPVFKTVLSGDRLGRNFSEDLRRIGINNIHGKGGMGIYDRAEIFFSLQGDVVSYRLVDSKSQYKPLDVRVVGKK